MPFLGGQVRDRLEKDVASRSFGLPMCIIFGWPRNIALLAQRGQVPPSAVRLGQ
jgi:hypothetical protein